MASARASRPRLGKSLLGLILCIGCTKVLGIDGDYVTDEALNGAAGHKATGGKSGAGGTPGPDGGGSGNTSAGGAETGGGGEGGAPPAGGAGAGGGPLLGCGATAGDCAAGEKCCIAANGVDTFCVKPEPSVGCSLLNCDHCPPPPDTATAICNQDQCDIQCNPGYVQNGNQCDPSGTGGSGGQGGSGTGGAPPVCDPKQCPKIKPCSLASPFSCCRSIDQTCGCTYVAGAYCL